MADGIFLHPIWRFICRVTSYLAKQNAEKGHIVQKMAGTFNGNMYRIPLSKFLCKNMMLNLPYIQFPNYESQAK